MPTRLSSRSVSARARTYGTVAAAALAAAGLVVATVAFTRTSTGGASSPHSQTTATAAKRAPALALDLSLRTDPEARALRRGNALYDRGARGQAARIFARYQSLPAQVGLALARWPRGSKATLERLAKVHPG